jgi:signal-transduction protein with cAMP-binding, CBS, and nucleotidyltransferase domain
MKGGRISSIAPEGLLADAVRTMGSNDIGSLVVMSNGAMIGMLTFLEVLGELNARIKQTNFENRLLKRYIKNWPEEEEKK